MSELSYYDQLQIFDMNLFLAYEPTSLQEVNLKLRQI